MQDLVATYRAADRQAAGSPGATEAAAVLAERCRQLHVTGVSPLADSEGEAAPVSDETPTLVTIGGILDNTVGFLFAPPTAVPAMGPNHCIWVELLEPRWYLLRTT